MINSAASNMMSPSSSATGNNTQSPGLKTYFKTPEGRYKLQYEKTHPAGLLHYAHGKTVTQVPAFFFSFFTFPCSLTLLLLGFFFSSFFCLFVCASMKKFFVPALGYFTSILVDGGAQHSLPTLPFQMGPFSLQQSSLLNLMIVPPINMVLFCGGLNLMLGFVHISAFNFLLWMYLILNLAITSNQNLVVFEILGKLELEWSILHILVILKDHLIIFSTFKCLFF